MSQSARSRALFATAAHLFITAFAFWMAWLLRFDFGIPSRELPVMYRGLLITVVAKALVFIVMRLDQHPVWRYHGLSDLIELVRNNLLMSVVSGGFLLLFLGSGFPRSIYCLDFLMCLLASGGARMALRIYREMSAALRRNPNGRGILIYGAGVAGISLAKEIRENPKLGYRVLGFLDDDQRKLGAKLLGLPVMASGKDAGEVVEYLAARGANVEEIVVSMPSATGREIRAAVDRVEPTGIPCRIVPSLGELISGKLSLAKMREISVTDLLGRDPVQLDLEHVTRALKGKSILVTGAAGSIGSELCNQLAQFTPERLVALDQAESELFRLEADLRSKYPSLHLCIEVGDIRDPRQVEDVIDRHSIDSIYHAAAYKHVPLMERQVCEAVRNNILGTWNLVQAAWRANVSSFLLISTDKAVNPTSIMGLTKRVAELIVSAKRYAPQGRKATKFVSVRFGNVLVSNGSVVPIFQKQIAAGGPVTVTHPDMRRYFMMVQEAVQLVIQASTMGKGSEVFVLDMGTPVKIVDLARKMITLAGFVPGEDIEIKFTGFRPGEKIFEEINLDSENTVPTGHSQIHVFQGNRIEFAQLVSWISELQHLLWRRDAQAIISHLELLVPEYQPEAAMQVIPVPQSVIDRHSPAKARLVELETAAG